MDIDTEQLSKEKGFEQRDVHVAAIVYTGIGLVVALALCVTVVKLTLFVYGASVRQPPLTPLETQREPVPEPHLESDPSSHGARIIQQARERLAGSGWVDPRRGIAHIPIAQAKAELVRTGWTTRAQWRPGERRYPLLRQGQQERAP
ncbi:MULTISPECIES: hypothetical protein [Pseudomonas]|uniref:hypothetical protein n=1 Tax=Pseudomonas TaxID=286 RepID=UPI0007322E2F|nr:hypothetical protein [Pseudomonas fluorescens]